MARKNAANRVHFRCTFHGKEATGTLTLEDGDRWIGAFQHSGNVVWPVEGRWQPLSLDRLQLWTKHGYTLLVLQENPDRTLTCLSQGGGFVDVQLVGVRTSALPYIPTWVQHA